MKKAIKVTVAIGMLLALASPALAAHKFNGYFHLAAYSEIERDGTKEGESQQFMLQRFRAKLTNQLNEHVGVVYYGEIDSDWGESGKGNIGGSGKLGADGVNIETKNAFLDLKAGNSSARLGIHGMYDMYEAVVFDDDMAGATFSHNFGAANLTAMYSKWEEGNRANWDDADMYGLQLSGAFNDNFKAGASVYYFDNNDTTFQYYLPGDTELFFYGVNAALGFDAFSLDGFVLYQDGTINATVGPDTDVKGLAASVKAKMNLSNGDLGLRLIYYSEADDAKEEGAWLGNFGGNAYYNDNLMLFLNDPYATNVDNEDYQSLDASQAGFGLIGAVASGNHNFANNMYFNWGAGFFKAMTDDAYDDNIDVKKGKTLGYEVAARIGKKFYDVVDVSLNGAYASFGDFYDNTVVDNKGQAADPDDVFKTYLMVHVPY